jgi:hypothetical protein
LEPLHGDACGAKSFDVLPLIFKIFAKKSRVLKMYRFFSPVFLRISVRGGVKSD